MIDREKVINDLQDAVNDDWMWRHADYYALTMERALALLKEQDAVKIKVKKINGSGRCGRCPNCSNELNEMEYPNYCGFCGRAVKWNDI